jgi:hypothetical protein
VFLENREWGIRVNGSLVQRIVSSFLLDHVKRKYTPKINWFITKAISEIFGILHE